MSGSRDKTYVYEGEEFFAAAVQSTHTKTVVLQAYTEALKEQAKGTGTFAQYEELANATFKLVNDSRTIQSSCENIIAKEKSFEAHNYASHHSSKTNFLSTIKEYKKQLTQHESAMRKMISENKGLLKLPSTKEFPGRSDVLKNVALSESHKQISNGFDRIENIAKEKKNKAINTSAADISVQYVDKRLTAAEMSLQAIITEQKTQYTSLKDDPITKGEAYEIGKKTKVEEKKLNKLISVHNEIKGLQEKILTAPLLQKRELGKNLKLKLVEGAVLATSYAKPENISALASARKPSAEADWISHAYKNGIDSNTIRDSLKIIATCEKNLAELQEKIATTNPEDSKLLSYFREVEKLGNGIADIQGAKNNEECSKANKSLSLQNSITDFLLQPEQGPVKEHRPRSGM